MKELEGQFEKGDGLCPACMAGPRIMGFCQRMTSFVRCIENTLAADVLTVRRIYEVLQVRRFSRLEK